MASITKNYNKNGDLISVKVRVYKGRDENGKELKPFIKSFKIPKGLSKRETEKYIRTVADTYEDECKDGFHKNDNMTFAKYAKYVLELKKERKKAKTSTLERYEELLERINSEIGYMKLTAINAKHLNDLYKKLGEAGTNKKTGEALSAKTILEHHRLISTILETAFKESMVKENVAKRATPPSVKRKTPNYFTIEELEKIQTALENESIVWKAITYLFLVTGCRRGEALGLKWENVHLEDSYVVFKINLLYSKELGIYEDTLKSERSNRPIKIPKVVVDILKELKAYHDKQRETLGDAWKNEGHLFVNETTGKVLHPDSVTKHLKNFSKKYGLKHINPHAFRHTVPSIMLANGIDIISVSAYLGHYAPSFTENTYAHIIDETKAKASDALADIILKKAI